VLAALAVLLGVACASAGAESGTVRTLRATTSTGRQGAFYVPAAHEPRPLPLAVFLHGTGGKGSLMLARVRAHAERDGFIVVAPDSASVAGVWTTVPTSEDTRHVMASVREVMTLPDLRVDRSHVLIAGFSVGGAVAARLASQEDVFTAFAVLHGHVSTDALGARQTP
jgi:poly(3-hydroxybutyrate) depolymerase